MLSGVGGVGGFNIRERGVGLESGASQLQGFFLRWLLKAPLRP